MVRCSPRTSLDASSPTAERRASNHAQRSRKLLSYERTRANGGPAVSVNLHQRWAWFGARPPLLEVSSRRLARAEHLTMRSAGVLHKRVAPMEPILFPRR